MPTSALRGSTMAWLVGTMFVAGGCDAPPLPMDTGVPLELAQHRASTLSSLRYTIELTIPEAMADPIQGRSLIGFVRDDPDDQPVVLDFLDPSERVESVVVNGAPAEWEAINDHVVIPASTFSEGANEIDIRYRAGDEAFNRNEEFLYALFVPDRAHFSLPVFDQPDLKASVRWKVTAPADWEVVANGPGGDESRYPDRVVHSFAESRPIPTYLFAIAAGRFQVEESVRDSRIIRMFHRETDTAKVARNKDAIFELHHDAIDWMEEYTGIEYPFQKFDFVLIPSFQYGGMEHPGGILYRQAGLMLDESATQGRILGRASLIAHETAHMWFGNLVTMKWFDDVWTKEVFANFMAAKIVHPSFPEVDHDLRFLTAHHPSAYGVDRTLGANPIRQPLDNLRFAGTLYGAIIYQKAPVVMRHLEARVGEEAFQRGLRRYLEEHAYGNATWPGLIAILDELTEEDLASWSRVWVEEAGRPTIRVERRGPDVVLTQEDPNGSGRVWPQTLGVRHGDVRRSRVTTIELGADEVTIPGAGNAAFVLPNGTGFEYGALVLDERSSLYLLGNIAGIEPAVARGAAWVSLWDQVLEGRVAVADFFDTAMEALPAEENELILSQVLGYVGTAYWRLSPPEARVHMARRLEEFTWEEANGARSATARAAFLSAFRNAALTEDGVAKLRGLWDGSRVVEGLPMSEPDQIALAAGLAVRGVPDAAQMLDEQRARIQNPDRAARFDFVRPSLSADPTVRADWVESLTVDENRAREPWVLEGLGHVHHPLRAEESLPLIRPALDLLEEVQRTGDIFFPGRWLGATLGGHGTPAANSIVETFLDERADLSPRLRLKVLQASDMLTRAAEIRGGA